MTHSGAWGREGSLLREKNRIGIMELDENIGLTRSLGGPAALGPAGVRSVFGPEYLDESRCRGWILGRIHPRGAFCPGCGRPVDDGRRALRFWSGKRLSCIGCGKKFTALTGTCLSGMHLDYRSLFFMLHMLDAGYSATEISGRIECDPTTVRNWRRRLS